MRTAVLCASLAVVFTPSTARAQVVSLTEADALSRLSEDSPRVRAIRTSIDIARADVQSAARWPNPRLTYDRESVAGITETIWMVSQPLPVTGRRGLEVQAASTLVAASSSRSDDAVRRARADLRLAFARLVAAQARERELNTARDRLRDVADILAKREAAGDTAGFDRLRAEREVLDLDADRTAAAIDRARAQAALAGFFGGSLETSRLVAVGGPPATSVPPPVETLVQRAESTRGELLALRKEADAAQLALEAADKRRIPEPEIVAGTKSSNIAGGDTGSVFAVHGTLPIFDRGNPERALALARRSQAQARADAFLVALRAEIAGLRSALIERRELAERYRSAAVNNAEEIERIARVSYDAGERAILELLDAYRTRWSARIRQAALDLAVRETELELEFVSGWEVQ